MLDNGDTTEDRHISLRHTANAATVLRKLRSQAQVFKGGSAPPTDIWMPVKREKTLL